MSCHSQVLSLSWQRLPELATADKLKALYAVLSVLRRLIFIFLSIVAYNYGKSYGLYFFAINRLIVIEWKFAKFLNTLLVIQLGKKSFKFKKYKNIFLIYRLLDASNLTGCNLIMRFGVKLILLLNYQAP